MASFSSFPTSAVGLPQSLSYKLPPSLPDSARGYNVSISPNGITQVVGQPIPALYTADGVMAPVSFNSQVLNFEIPCGQGAGIFLDPRETMLSFRLTWNVTTAGATTASDCTIIGSAASFFDSLQLYSNNVPIETVAQYGLLHNMLLNSTVNSAERFGGCAVGLGCDINSTSGVNLQPNPVGAYYYNFCIPLISVIGLNCLDKLIPVGSIQNLVLQMQTANMLPITSYCSGPPTTQAVVAAPILDMFTLNMKYIDIGESASHLMQQTLQDGKWFIKANTYTHSAITIPNGSSGSSSLVYQIRNSSVKSLFLTNGTATSKVCPNGYYDAVNCSLTSLQASVGGDKFPNKPFNPSVRPAECFAGGLMAAWGASSLKSYGGTISRSAYGATIPSRLINYDDMMLVPIDGVRGISNTETNPPPSYAANTVQSLRTVQNGHMHYIGFNLERCGGTLFSGVNTRSSPPFVDVTFGTAMTSTIQSNAWGLIDAVLCIDTTSKTIQSYI